MYGHDFNGEDDETQSPKTERTDLQASTGGGGDWKEFQQIINNISNTMSKSSKNNSIIS